MGQRLHGAARCRKMKERVTFGAGCGSWRWRTLVCFPVHKEPTMSGKPAVDSSLPFNPYDVVVLGAGYAGLMAALRMARRKHRLRIGLVSARDQFLERVRLQEGIVAAVPLRIPS